MKAFFALPASLAGFVLTQAATAAAAAAAAAPPSIYVFATPSQPAAAAVTDALHVLGYSRADAPHLAAASASAGWKREDRDLAGLPGRRGDSTYAILSPAGTEYMNISRLDAGAKFILPTRAGAGAASCQRGRDERAHTRSWFGAGAGRPEPTSYSSSLSSDDADAEDAVRGFFATADVSQQLLELDIGTPRPDMRALTWESLCEFLGLGYSVVERLKLWRLP
ncbi:hypothetical protein GGR56DRAFT_678242 [Xylariaceae sp. FL0804]|nr:hypothetical protein GGR56DRAFT_678242 [Xylariaceae sp. FL0804]